jgi:D-sedoheptulose 7-phosphate isomerase
MVEQRIQQHFFEGADLKFQSAETLARPIAEGAAALLSAITGGGKVMVCGSGAGSVLAQQLARLFTGRFERERPPLAALALGAEPAQQRQQIRALGLPGDVLLYIDDGEGHSTAVISAAQAKDMTIVVLAGRGASAFAELLAETDVLIPVPHERPARVAELQLLVLHCLCDAVDFQLMGEQDP